jgi:hypothetical protein
MLVGFIMFMITLKVTSEYPINQFGHVSDIWFVSLTTYTSIIFIIDTKLIIITRSWTWLNVVGLLVLSIGIYIPYVFITDMMPGTFHTANTAFTLFASPVFWLLLFLLTGVFICVDVIIAVIGKHITTDLGDMFRSVQRRYKNNPKMGAIYQRALEWHEKMFAEELPVSEATPKNNRERRRPEAKKGSSKRDETTSKEKPRSKSSDASLSKDFEMANSHGREQSDISGNTPGFGFVVNADGKRSPTRGIKISPPGLSASPFNYGSEKKVSDNVELSFGPQAWPRDSDKEVVISEGDPKMDTSIHETKNEDAPAVFGKSAFFKSKLDDIASEGSQASDREDASAHEIKKLRLKKLGLSSGSENDGDRGLLTSERQGLNYGENDF